MVVTILHISDIHRTRDAEVSNTVLLDSLLRDLERQGINKSAGVDLIVVSGDVIQGVGADDPDADAKLAAQYSEAEAFLSALAAEVVGGDRSRIVIVPGNHDINWRASLLSMTEMPDVTGEDLKKRLAQVSTGRSKIRWSWKTLKFFHISDADLYARRMAPYADFIGRFHGGTRAFALEDQHQYAVLVFDHLKLVVLALNSCWHNDHLQYVGQIRPECFAGAATQLRERGLGDHLVIAVWHHNTRGLPLDTGYLDYRCLENLLDAGVTLGLHGHQHLTEVVTEQARVMRGRKMLIVSAGSLCAGPAELPPGERRSYNVIRIADDRKRIMVNTSISVSSDAFAPIWMPDSPGVVEAELPTLSPVHGRTFARDLDEAAGLVRSKRYKDALALLSRIPERPETRRLRLECLSELGDSATIVAEFVPPTSVSEAIAVLEAAWGARQRAVAKQVLELPFVRDSDDPAMRSVREKYQALLGGAS